MSSPTQVWLIKKKRSLPGTELLLISSVSVESEDIRVALLLFYVFNGDNSLDNPIREVASRFLS
jgi:hypothetical protein